MYNKDTILQIYKFLFYKFMRELLGHTSAIGGPCAGRVFETAALYDFATI